MVKHRQQYGARAWLGLVDDVPHATLDLGVWMVQADYPPRTTPASSRMSHTTPHGTTSTAMWCMSMARANRQHPARSTKATQDLGVLDGEHTDYLDAPISTSPTRCGHRLWLTINKIYSVQHLTKKITKFTADTAHWVPRISTRTSMQSSSPSWTYSTMWGCKQRVSPVSRLSTSTAPSSPGAGGVTRQFPMFQPVVTADNEPQVPCVQIY